MDSRLFDVCYGGARGGGKTDAALGDFAFHAQKFGQGARGLLVRRTRTALEPTIARARELFRPFGGVWADQKSRFTFEGGAGSLPQKMAAEARPPDVVRRDSRETI